MSKLDASRAELALTNAHEIILDAFEHVGILRPKLVSVGPVASPQLIEPEDKFALDLQPVIPQQQCLHIYGSARCKGDLCSVSIG